MKTLQISTPILALCLATFASSPVSAHDCQKVAAELSGSTNLPGTSLYQLKGTWESERGEKISLSSFRGQPVIAAMIYTSCKAACPMITAEMRRIERDLPPALRLRVQFVLFSFDSDRDTPERLLKFAQANALDLHRWTLMNGSPDSVRELAATLGIRYKRDPVGDFQHSNIITLLDSEGTVREQLEGLGRDPQALIQKLETLPEVRRQQSP